MRPGVREEDNPPAVGYTHHQLPRLPPQQTREQLLSIFKRKKGLAFRIILIYVID